MGLAQATEAVLPHVPLKARLCFTCCQLPPLSPSQEFWENRRAEAAEVGEEGLIIHQIPLGFPCPPTPPITFQLLTRRQAKVPEDLHTRSSPKSNLSRASSPHKLIPLSEHTNPTFNLNNCRPRNIITNTSHLLLL